MKTILIYIEDDGHILQYLQQLVKTLLREIRLYQVEVITATSSSNVSEILKCSQVDLLLLEDNDEVQRCMEFVETISNKPITVLMTKRPIISTGLTMTIKGEIAETLERPIGRRELKALLKKFLSQDSWD